MLFLNQHDKRRVNLYILNLATTYVEKFFNIASVYQRVFLPDTTTTCMVCNRTTWKYRMCRGIKAYSTNEVF